MENLPADLHAHIFSFLPNAGAFALETVSRRMKMAVETYAGQLKEMDLRVGSEGRNRAVVSPRWSRRALLWLRRYESRNVFRFHTSNSATTHSLLRSRYPVSLAHSWRFCTSPLFHPMQKRRR
jgi:hypothetical protein